MCLKIYKPKDCFSYYHERNDYATKYLFQFSEPKLKLSCILHKPKNWQTWKMQKSVIYVQEKIVSKREKFIKVAPKNSWVSLNFFVMFEELICVKLILKQSNSFSFDFVKSSAYAK